MKAGVFLLSLLIANSTIVCGQKKKGLPQEGFIVLQAERQLHRYPGKREIYSNDSVKQFFYQTDSSVLRINKKLLRDSVTNIGNILSDSLVAMLFRQGLLTADLLLDGIYGESKEVWHTGDTVTQPARAPYQRDVLLVSIRRIPARPDQKGRSLLVLEIGASFRNPPQDASGQLVLTGGFTSSFELTLEGTRAPSASNLEAYLQQATIKRFIYNGTEI